MWKYFKCITQKLHRNSGKAGWDHCKVAIVIGEAKKKSIFCSPELCAEIQLGTRVAEGCSPPCANRVAFVGSCGLQWDILSWEGPKGVA